MDPHTLRLRLDAFCASLDSRRLLVPTAALAATLGTTGCPAGYMVRDTAPGDEKCFNQVDDNGDGLVDCDDPLCVDLCGQPLYGAVQMESVCDDGLDDDGDGLVDCADPDCADLCTEVMYGAVQSEADCANGVDDDGDSLVDCDDPDCAGDPACTAGAYAAPFNLR